MGGGGGCCRHREEEGPGEKEGKRERGKEEKRERGKRRNKWGIVQYQVGERERERKVQKNDDCKLERTSYRGIRSFRWNFHRSLITQVPV